MSITRKLILLVPSILSAFLLMAPLRALCQVSPAEIVNPRLKALEQADLDKLMEMNHEISDLKFPFKFALSRFVGVESRNPQGADSRGIEFVKFHDRTILKISGNYSAAFNSELLTQNERTTQVLDSVVVPILRLLPKYYPASPSFDAFGFEISYHVRTHSKQFGYEGKENLVLVFDKADVPAYLNAARDSQRQEIIDRSQVYLDGKEFGLAFGQRKAFDVESLDKSARNNPVMPAVVTDKPVSKTVDAAPAEEAKPVIARVESKPADPKPAPVDRDIRLAGLYRDTLPTFRLPRDVEPAALPAAPLPATPGVTPAPAAIDLDELQKKYQPQLDALSSDGVAHYHFVSYAPASIGLFHKQVYLQITLRNPALFDRNGSSIYKRAAQSFDLFLAPQLKGLLAKVPTTQEIAGVDVTVLDEFSRTAPASSEALEFICPLVPLRQFADAEITNQDLINQSVVLVNGVRIGLNLQQVE